MNAEENSMPLRTRIATAIAVIRMKPKDEFASGEEYAKHLSEKLEKKRNGNLKNEELSTKQKTALSDLEFNAHLLIPSSHKGMLNNGKDLLEHKIKNMSLLIHEGSHQRSNVISEAVKQHIQFIENVIRLYSIVADTGMNREHIVWNNVINDATSSTLKELLNFLSKGSGLSLPDKVWDDVVTQISHLMKTISNKYFLAEVKDFCEDIIRKIMEDIMSWNTMDQFETQTRRSMLILSLCENETIREKAVEMLLQITERYSIYLQNVLSQEEEFLPYTFENIYFILETLEKIFSSCVTNDPKWPNKETGQRWLTLLDESVLFISHNFPLFTVYVWLLRAILEKALLTSR